MINDKELKIEVVKQIGTDDIVIITHVETGITVKHTGLGSQIKNKNKCLEELERLIYDSRTNKR